ncbi:MAG: methyltransferase domain-containing protein [Chloroflexi bacterium]|nr:methyltransferase domain-containing protein [Chloroflexota bacterium]
MNVENQPSRLARSLTTTRRRYDRQALVYDLVESLPEWTFAHWRRLLWDRVTGGHILEVGVGTGKNIPYYPAGADVVAVDLSSRMLRRAVRRTREGASSVELMQMAAESLAFPDHSFDYVATTFVLCSVSDPIGALREMGRVCKPVGTLLLLEHVRIERPLIGLLMDLLNPVAVRMTGANINRRTVANARRAGLILLSLESLAPMGLVTLITAKPPR